MSNLKDLLYRLGGVARRDNLYKLILEKGDVYESAELTQRELDFVEAAAGASICQFEAKQCFSNSQLFMLAVRNIEDDFPDVEASYIEGFFALSDIPIPIHHGWVSVNGKVVDLTLTQDVYDAGIDGLEDRVIGRVPSDFEYIGLPIETVDVLYRIEEHLEAHNFLDDRRPHMRDLRKKYYRRNPMKTVQMLETYIGMSDIPDLEAYEYAKEFYPESLTEPDTFLKNRPERAGYLHVHGRNFIFVGPRGRLLKVYAEDIEPVQGNAFYHQKIQGLAVAPKFSDFKIPLFVGYVDPWVMYPSTYEEKIEYKDEYYEPDEDDIGEIFFQLRDGNHRTIAALMSGEPYAYVQISENAHQDYREWIEAGRPDKWPGGTAVLKYLDENLV